MIYIVICQKSTPDICLKDTASFSSLYDFRIAFVTPDGQWRFPPSLTDKDIADSKAMPLCDAIQFITAQKN